MQNYQINLKPTAVQVHKGAEARKRLLEGAQTLAKCVGVTYGPGGRVVMLDRATGLLATKDGVTVAREIEVEDPVANLGCQILKTACIKVNDDVGDGTTSTAIVAAAILEEGQKVISGGMAPIPLLRGLQAAAQRCLEVAEGLASPVEDQALLERVAMIASNGDEDVSKKMAEACMAVGNDGTLTIEDGNSVGIELVFKEGMEIDRGAASPHFLGSQHERVIEGPLVALIGADLRTVDDVRSVMEVASQWPNHELLLIAQSIEGDALKTMLMNDTKGVMKCIGINSPGFHDKKKEILKDIAALSGADFVDPNLGYDITNWDPEWFGGFRKVSVFDKKAVFVAHDEAQELVDERVKLLKAEKQRATSDYDTDKLNERIAKLSGGLCIMQVGGYTEAEMRERRARIEDALGSVRAALAEGVVPGAASTYHYCAAMLLLDLERGEVEGDIEYVTGWKVLARALLRPVEVLSGNAGHQAAFTAQRLLEGYKSGEIDPWQGWDANTGGLRNLADEPAVVDPLAVVRSVIEASVSSAGTLLTVEASLSKG